MIRFSIAILFAAALLLPATTAKAQQFEGLYVGAQMGYSEVKLTFLGISATDDTALVGAFTGYRDKTSPGSSWVWGVEFDGNFITNGSEWFLGASGIVGYLTSPKSMIYTRAGYVRWPNDFNDLDGWMTGVGYEQFFGSKTSLRLDYRYMDFNSYMGVDTSAHALMLGVVIDW